MYTWETYMCTLGRHTCVYLGGTHVYNVCQDIFKQVFGKSKFQRKDKAFFSYNNEQIFFIITNKSIITLQNKLKNQQTFVTSCSVFGVKTTMRWYWHHVQRTLIVNTLSIKNIFDSVVLRQVVVIWLGCFLVWCIFSIYLRFYGF